MTDFFGRAGKRPAIATDTIIVAFDEDRLWILLVERGHGPYKGKWALPGGFMEWNESCEESAARELKEETTLENIPLDLLGVFSKPGRDPRGTIVSIIYIGIVRKDQVHPKGGDDAVQTQWFPFDVHPPLAFDHEDVLISAQKYLQKKKLMK